MLGKVRFYLLLVILTTAVGRASAADEPQLPQNVTTVAQEQEEQSGSQQDEEDITKVLGEPIARVEVSEYDAVSVHAQNVRMSTVLQELAVKSHRNIILSAGADRMVSMTFYSVPFDDALHTMLDVNGLGYREEDNFISVFTKTELIDRMQGAEGITSQVFLLNYLRPKEALASVKGLLSGDGSVEAMEDDKPQEKAANMSMEGTKKEDPVYKPESQRFSLRSALIVHDYQPNIDAIAALLKKLDRRPAQVLLEATILEVNLNENNALGVDFALLKDTSFLEFFNFDDKFSPFSTATVNDNGQVTGYNTSKNLTTPILATSMGNVGTGAATIRGGFSYSDFGVFIRALSQYTNVSVLSNPKVLSLDRQRARVMMGQNVGYIETSFQDGQIIQTTKFIETGIVLDVRPYILENGMVRLVLAPKVSKVDFRNQQLQQGITQQIPDETIKTVAADIVIPQGATAVIGGLFQEQTQKNAQQVPFLGDVPALGALARGQDDAIARKELVFLIRATVVSDNELVDMGNSGMNDTEQMLSGSRQGLLPWSKIHQSGHLSLKAKRALYRGDSGLAAWMARRSLQLGNRQPDVIRQLVDTIEPEADTLDDGAMVERLQKRLGVQPSVQPVPPLPVEEGASSAPFKPSADPILPFAPGGEEQAPILPRDLGQPGLETVPGEALDQTDIPAVPSTEPLQPLGAVRRQSVFETASARLEQTPAQRRGRELSPGELVEELDAVMPILDAGE